MDILHAVVLGVVEGATEFLPISSTAHLVLASDLMRLEQSNFLKSFEIIIQTGAILAVVALYWRKFMDLELLKRLVVAFVPTGIVGFVLYKLIKSFFIGNTILILCVLGVGGVLLIVFERYIAGRELKKESLDMIDYRTSFLIGLAQSLAVVPGVSRAAATIVGGMLLGVSRATIVEFSFLLAVPTMVAATGFDILKNPGVLVGADLTYLSVGLAVSFVTALGSIKWLLGYIRHHTFTGFGIYRVLISLVFGLYILNIL